MSTGETIKNLYKRYILLWKEEVIVFNFRSVAEVVLLLFYKITYQGQGYSALSLEHGRHCLAEPGWKDKSRVCPKEVADISVGGDVEKKMTKATETGRQAGKSQV